MRLSKIAIAENSVAISVGLSLIGYTVLLMVFSNVTGGIAGSRMLTVPVRIVIVGLLVVAFIMAGRINRHPAVLCFLTFSGLYLFRILIESSGQSSNLYQTPVEFLLYFVSFTALPFLILSSISFNRRLAEKVLWVLVFLAIVFALVTISFYGNYIGQVGRISHAVGRDGAYISPLSLSYQSSIIIGIILAYWSVGHVSVLRAIGMSALLILLAVPFFLGASRGSVVALGLVILFFLSFSPGLQKRAWFFVGTVLIIILAFVLQGYLGDGIVARVGNIQRDIDTGSTSAIRLLMWREGIEQFLSAPIFGNSLQHEGFRHHPHNMFIEVLIATGVIGVVPFSLFLIWVAREAIRVIRKAPELSWVVVIFLVGFASNMFSGSVSAAVIMATGAGLVLAASRDLDRLYPDVQKLDL